MSWRQQEDRRRSNSPRGRRYRTSSRSPKRGSPSPRPRSPRQRRGNRSRSVSRTPPRRRGQRSRSRSPRPSPRRSPRRRSPKRSRSPERYRRRSSRSRTPPRRRSRSRSPDRRRSRSPRRGRYSRSPRQRRSSPRRGYSSPRRRSPSRSPPRRSRRSPSRSRSRHSRRRNSKRSPSPRRRSPSYSRSPRRSRSGRGGSFRSRSRRRSSSRRRSMSRRRSYSRSLSDSRSREPSPIQKRSECDFPDILGSGLRILAEQARRDRVGEYLPFLPQNEYEEFNIVRGRRVRDGAWELTIPKTTGDCRVGDGEQDNTETVLARFETRVYVGRSRESELESKLLIAAREIVRVQKEERFGPREFKRDEDEELCKVCERPVRITHIRFGRHICRLCCVFECRKPHHSRRSDYGEPRTQTFKARVLVDPITEKPLSFGICRGCNSEAEFIEILPNDQWDPNPPQRVPRGYHRSNTCPDCKRLGDCRARYYQPGAIFAALEELDKDGEIKLLHGLKLSPYGELMQEVEWREFNVRAEVYVGACVTKRR